MAYIPSVDKPAEVSELHLGLAALADCRDGAGYDLARLDRWLRQWPRRMEEAAERLDTVLDEHYPPEQSA